MALNRRWNCLICLRRSVLVLRFSLDRASQFTKGNFYLDGILFRIQRHLHVHFIRQNRTESASGLVGARPATGKTWRLT